MDNLFGVFVYQWQHEIELYILALIGDLKDIIPSLIVWEPDIIMPNLPVMSSGRNASLNKDWAIAP